MNGRSRGVRLCAIALTAAMVIGGATAASAQQQELRIHVAPGPAAPAPQPAPAPASAPQQTVSPPAAPSPPLALPDSDYKPGFLDQLGRWINDAGAKVSSGLKGAGNKIGEVGSAATDTAKGAAAVATDAAKGAANSLSKFPSSGIVGGREPCVVAANGAPDCGAAADAVCRKKGSAAGRSLDTQTTEECPVPVLLSGRPSRPGECKTVTYVTRALCQ